MPKIKTHSGLKKRLKRTGSGKLKRSHAYISHLSHNKTHKQKKHLAKDVYKRQHKFFEWYYFLQKFDKHYLYFDKFLMYKGNDKENLL